MQINWFLLIKPFFIIAIFPSMWAFCLWVQMKRLIKGFVLIGDRIWVEIKRSMSHCRSFGQLRISLSTSARGPWATRAAAETGNHPSEPGWRQVRAIFPWPVADFPKDKMTWHNASTLLFDWRPKAGKAQLPGQWREDTHESEAKPNRQAGQGRKSGRAG